MSAIGHATFARVEGRTELRILGAKALLIDAGLDRGDDVTLEISADQQLQVCHQQTSLRHAFSDASWRISSVTMTYKCGAQACKEMALFCMWLCVVRYEDVSAV